MELNQARDITDNKKDFCKSRHRKRKTTENVTPFLLVAENLMAQEKAAVLNSFFAPVCSARYSLQESWVAETKGKGWRKECILFVEGNQIRQYLFKLDIQNSMGLDEMHPEMLRKIIIRRSPSGLEEGKCHSCVQERQEGEIRELQASQPCLNPQKSDRAANPAKHFPGMFLKGKEVIMTAVHDSPKKRPACQLSKRSDWPGRQGENSGYFLPGLRLSPIKILIDKLLIQGLDEVN